MIFLSDDERAILRAQHKQERDKRICEPFSLYLDRFKREKNGLQSAFEAYESDRRPFMEKYITGGRWLSVNFLDRSKDKNQENPYIIDF